MADNTGAAFGDNGMTLRDYFAGQALPAVIAATSAGWRQPGVHATGTLAERMAFDAYELADAMLAAKGAP